MTAYAKPKPDLASLRHSLAYCPKLGIMVWLAGPMLGKQAGGKVYDGDDAINYIRIKFNGVRYKQHQLVWYLMTGEWIGETRVLSIDHINRICDDDRWVNLRKADKREQCLNRGAPKPPRNFVATHEQLMQIVGRAWGLLEEAA